MPWHSALLLFLRLCKHCVGDGTVDSKVTQTADEDGGLGEHRRFSAVQWKSPMQTDVKDENDATIHTGNRNITEWRVMHEQSNAVLPEWHYETCDYSQITATMTYVALLMDSSYHLIAALLVLSISLSLWRTSRACRGWREQEGKRAQPDHFTERPMAVLEKFEAQRGVTCTDRCKQIRKGDGNCYWRSIAGKQWKRAKAQVRAQSLHYRSQFTEEDWELVQEALQRDAWITAPAIRLSALALSLKVGIYMVRPASQKWTLRYVAHDPRKRPAAEVCVAYNGRHYDRLRARLPQKSSINSLGTSSNCPEGPQKMRQEPVGQVKNPTPPPNIGHIKRKESDQLQEEQKMARWSKKSHRQLTSKSQRAMHQKHTPLCPNPPDAREGRVAALQADAGWQTRWMQSMLWMTMLLRCWDPSGPSMRSAATFRESHYGQWLAPFQSSDSSPSTALEPDQTPLPRPRTFLRGGGLRTPVRVGQTPPHTPRHRARQLQVGHGADTLRTYVETAHDQEGIEKAVALHYGMAPQWTERIWHHRNHITVRNRLRQTTLTQEGREHLADLLQPFKLGAAFRSLSTTRELYLGLRTTRQPGLTVASMAYQSETQTLNAHLKTRLPGMTWHAIGLVEHTKIRPHVDQGVTPLSLVCTLARRPHFLKIQSPLTGAWQLLQTNKGFLAFDPTKVHSIEGEGRALSVVLYTPQRQPTEEQCVHLALLGFPVRMPTRNPMAPLEGAGQPTQNRLGTEHDQNQTRHSPARPQRVGAMPSDAPEQSGYSSENRSGIHIRTTTTSRKWL